MAGLLLVVSSLASLSGAANAAAVNFRGSAFQPVKGEEAKEVLLLEMADTDHHLAPLEEELRPLFVSLPKNAHGNLGHQTARFALHRFFAKKHGWYMKGLDNGMAHMPKVYEKDNASRTAPDYLQEYLERRVGEEGADLRGLATLAAALVDLVQHEVRSHLKLAYTAENLPTQTSQSRSRVLDALRTFFIGFALENNWTVANDSDLAKKKRMFASKYSNHQEATDWVEGIRSRTLGNEDEVSFETAARVADDITKEYHAFNDNDCRDLRATLHKMESQTPGRVRLSTFYNASLFTHWLFVEKESILSALGTVDYSNRNQPHVIIPNYVLARPNCLKSSSIYAICCRNICEDLLAHLEKEVGGPTAPPQVLAKLVAALPSESVSAPRELPEQLLQRLEEVAAVNGGQVPLHGRLFTQWMHHAYPLECPYPQEGGSTDPQTLDAWLQEAGQVTEEEIKERVQADTCAASFDGQAPREGCGEESNEVPWSATEQLLSVSPAGRVRVTSKSTPEAAEQTGSRWRLSMALLLAVLVAALLATSVLRKDARELRWQMQLAASLLAVLAYVAGLLNGRVLALSMGGSVLARLFALQQNHAAKKLLLPMQGKVV